MDKQAYLANIEAFQRLTAILSASNDDQIQALLTNTSPEQFENLFLQINWHRIVVIFHSKIRRHQDLLPARFINKLTRLNANMTTRSLTGLHLLTRLQKSFDEKSIRFLAFKGAALSQLIYQTPVMRSAKDVDILVHPTDMLNAHTALKGLGLTLYHPKYEPGSPEFTVYMQRQKDAIYISKSRPVELEIHWRLDINAKIMDVDFDQWWDRRKEILIQNCQIHTFDHTDTCCHLITHGGVSMWGRLSWLYDWWQMIQDMQKDDNPNEATSRWTVLQEQIKRRNLDRMMVISLSLLKEIFGADIPQPYCKAPIPWQARAITRLIIKSLHQRQYATSWKRTLARTALKPELSYKTSYAQSVLSRMLAKERNLFD